MSNALSERARRVQEALAARGFTFRVVELPASTRTAPEAAAAVGCRVEQIANSLVFRGKTSGAAILVIASGGARVNESKLALAVGEPVEKPDAEFVRAQTGFVIGGVPPVGHIQPLRTWIDQSLLHHDRIWAAAGTPHAVFELSAADLPALTGGTLIEVR